MSHDTNIGGEDGRRIMEIEVRKGKEGGRWHMCWEDGVDVKEDCEQRIDGVHVQQEREMKKGDVLLNDMI